MRMLKLALPILLIGVGLWGGFAWWQQSRRLPITEATVFRSEFSARPRMRPEVSAIYVNLEAPPNQSTGELIFRLHRLEAVGSIPKRTNVGGLPTISVVDLEKVSWRNGSLMAWETMTVVPGLLRLKIWRQDDDMWTVASESPIETTVAGYNRFVLDPPLEIYEGDYLGYFAPQSPLQSSQLGPLSEQVKSGKPSLGQLYIPNVDFKGRISETDLIRDSSGNYSFRALYSPREDLKATLRLQSGRATYRLEFPSQEFALGEKIELSIEATEGAQAFIYPFLPSLLSTHQYFRFEYGTQSPASVATVIQGAKRWPISDIFLIVIAGLGCISLFGRPHGRSSVVWAALPVLAAAAVWEQLVSAGPVAQLVPVIVSFLVVPGFIVLELAFPALSLRLGALERPPLLFGFSIAFWTLIATMAYRLQWASNTVIWGVLLCDLIGLLIILVFKPGCSEAQSDQREHKRQSHFEHFYVTVLLIFIVAAAALIAFHAQFQPASLDIYSHLAGFRNIADNPRIMGGNMFLGPTYTFLAHYVSNPWYLALGLVSRAGHTNVSWSYVCIAGMLTMFFFLCFYSMLKTLMNHHLVAVVGTLLVVWPWLYELAKKWTDIHTFYLEFLPSPDDLTTYVLFPLLITYILRYVRYRDLGHWSATVLLAFAAMGQHGTYLVWIPTILGLALLVVFCFSDSRLERARVLSLLLAVVCLAAGLTYLYLSYPTAGFNEPIDATANYDTWKNAGTLWHFSQNLYSENPRYLLENGWKEFLGLVFIALLTLFHRREKVQRQFKWRLTTLSFSLPARASIPWCFVGAVAAILMVPWLIVFNPVVAPRVADLFNAPLIIYRMLGANTVFSHALTVSIGAYLLSLPFLINRSGKVPGALKFLPLLAMLLWLSLSDFRSVMMAPFEDRGGYSSIIDLSNDPLYRGLSNLEPGVVAAEGEQASLVAALSPHNVVSVRRRDWMDYRTAVERQAENDKIVTFSVTPEEMRLLLDKNHCRYIIVPFGSPQFRRFLEHPELFDEILRVASEKVVSHYESKTEIIGNDRQEIFYGPTDVVFEVKG